MARWVLPVLVGPSTAVTPAPRARKSCWWTGEKEIGIEGPDYRAGAAVASVSQQHDGKASVLGGTALCLRCGTSLERIAAESATRGAFDFVHCDIWRCHWLHDTRWGVWSGFLGSFSRPKKLTSLAAGISGKSRDSPLWIVGIAERCSNIVASSRVRSVRRAAIFRNGESCTQDAACFHCTFTLAAARGGFATEINCVAWTTPVPTGVGNEKRNGTSTRVPTIGASQTSASRNCARYLMA